MGASLDRRVYETPIAIEAIMAQNSLIPLASVSGFGVVTGP